MPTNTSSERSGEAERSEGPQDTCYQVPLCPFAFLLPCRRPRCSTAGALAEAWNIRGNDPYPLDPYPSPLFRAAGVRVWLFRLVIAPSGCTADSTSAIRPYPHADPSSRGTSEAGVRVCSRRGAAPVRHPAAVGGTAFAAQRIRPLATPSLRLWTTLCSTARRGGAAGLAPSRCAGCTDVDSPRSGAAAAACQHFMHRVRGGRSAPCRRRTFRPRAVLRLALARRARGGSSWTHQKKRGPAAATS